MERKRGGSNWSRAGAAGARTRASTTFCRRFPSPAKPPTTPSSRGFAPSPIPSGSPRGRRAARTETSETTFFQAFYCYLRRSRSTWRFLVTYRTPVPSPTVPLRRPAAVSHSGLRSATRPTSRRRASFASATVSSCAPPPPAPRAPLAAEPPPRAPPPSPRPPPRARATPAWSPSPRPRDPFRDPSRNRSRRLRLSSRRQLRRRSSRRTRRRRPKPSPPCTPAG
mmetsp:Transcript_4191/g.17801  ORF Transcript_4191/g.17801 Transcript_4191/m.17801 type:complete len:224 (+) Transcript_4191:826-1497(+)